MKLTSDQIEALRQFGDWAEELAEKLAAGEVVSVERETVWRPREEHLKLARMSFQASAFLDLCAYRVEFQPGVMVPPNGQPAWFVFVSKSGAWLVGDHSEIRIPGVVYMQREVAEDLARKLNSGEVVL